MPYVDKSVLDAALQHIIDNTQRVWLLTEDATNCAEASDHELGHADSGFSWEGPRDGTIGDGREIALQPFLSPSNATAAGSAQFYALSAASDSAGDPVLLSYTVNSPKDLEEGDGWGLLSELIILLPDYVE